MLHRLEVLVPIEIVALILRCPSILLTLSFPLLELLIVKVLVGSGAVVILMLPFSPVALVAVVVIVVVVVVILVLLLPIIVVLLKLEVRLLCVVVIILAFTVLPDICQTVRLIEALPLVATLLVHVLHLLLLLFKGIWATRRRFQGLQF